MSNFGTNVVILCPNFFTFLAPPVRDREAKFPEFFYDFDRDLVTRLPIYDFFTFRVTVVRKHREIGIFCWKRAKSVKPTGSCASFWLGAVNVAVLWVMGRTHRTRLRRRTRPSYGVKELAKINSEPFTRLSSYRSVYRCQFFGTFVLK